ncbi:hypothetical protein BKA65DRAFT_196003 [Rhexocercosporidium sp. MPI-PUGE-AT-0058]|nr:hypothetical protein BKA65DRAFT_196003 [Rhexocercosporidium sp. MPI-PUGE-AT-0058]
MKKIQEAKNKWTHSPDNKIRLDLSSKLCNRCRTIDLETYLSSLPYLENSCDLCQILSKIPEEAKNNNPKIRLSKASQYVRISAVPDLKPKHRLTRDLQHISNPKGQCSRSGGCCPNPDRSWMPTRVIDVGDGDTAWLVLKNKENMSKGAQYVALSHC